MSTPTTYSFKDILTADLPQELKDLLLRYNWLEVVRDDTRSTPSPLYTFRCTRCGDELYIAQRTVESSELRFWDHAFTQGKPGIDDGDTTVQCNCPTGDEDEYDIEFQPYY